MNTIKLNGNYKTRTGHKVNLVGIGKDKTFPIVGEIISEDGSVELDRWTLAGKYSSDSNRPDEWDLVEAPSEITLDVEEYTVVVTEEGVSINYATSGDFILTLTRHTLEEIFKAYKTFN